MFKKIENKQFYKKKVTKRGFTLIELLAVIIILGILMIIAVPSVTEYIQTSRRESYVRMATQYINGAITKVNSATLPMYDVEAVYYYPAKCIALEKGGDSPFGELKEAYIVITYNGTKYDYYWTSRDATNTGILLTADHLLHESKVKAGITNINTDIGIEGKTKILLINDCDGYDIEEIEPVETIPVDGEYVAGENTNNPTPSPEPTSNSLYNVITMQNKVNGSKVLDNQASTYVSASTGINFGEIPSDTNGKGVYIRGGTENNTYPIYYYRGEVTNNNVIFAGFCWKIMRTTETGGIKLIYNGVPTDGSCDNISTATQIGTSKFNEVINTNAYVGYMYGVTNGTTYDEVHLSTKTSTSSTVKNYIDDWYEDNLNGYTDYLEDAIWCNDRSFSSTNTGTGIGGSTTYYGSYGRTYSGGTPSFDCVNQNDRFTLNVDMAGRGSGNGALTYPVALPTADELAFAGILWARFSDNYLYSEVDFWTMSPSYFIMNYARMHQTMGPSLTEGNGKEVRAVRPTISLKNNITIEETGDGSVDSPFFVIVR